jgi:DNA polymerase
MRTYDIINAGPRNRFMANGRIVSNSGRRIQLQNLPQNHMKDLDFARQKLINGNFEELKKTYDNVPLVLSELIRTAIIPSPGYKFFISDFSSIEARVAAWVSGEDWVLDVFRGDGKIYEATASKMFKIPMNTIVPEHENYSFRQKGKQASLACQYGGSVGALIRLGALDKGLTEPELKPLVDAWRNANPNVVNYWYTLSNAAFKAVRTRQAVNLNFGIQFKVENGILFMRLPSGRRLAYVNPHIKMNKNGYDELHYMGWELGNWISVSTWGGKLLENLVQATSRDILLEAMERIDKKGFKTILHCHDEVVIEVPNNSHFTIDQLNDIMSIRPKWSSGLPLRAAGFECIYYQK